MSLVCLCLGCCFPTWCTFLKGSREWSGEGVGKEAFLNNVLPIQYPEVLLGVSALGLLCEGQGHGSTPVKCLAVRERDTLQGVQRCTIKMIKCLDSEWLTYKKRLKE